MLQRAKEWVVHRFGLKPIADHFLFRRVPKSPWYFGDGATLLTLLGVQVLTGAVLSLTYSPTPDTAYRSVQYISTEQLFGWFIRGLHYWAGGLMVVMLVFHLFRQILVAGYKSPREGTWLIGVVMFFIVIATSYFGYTLRWDQRAEAAIRVSAHMLHNVPLIGEDLVYFAYGGSDVGDTTLLRFYSLHVIWLPLLLLGLAGFHLYLIVLRGTTTRGEREQLTRTAEEQEKVYKEESESPNGGESFYPETTFKSGVFGTIVLAGAILLAIFVGAPALLPEAGAVDTSIPAEEWWFWWYSALIALLPSAIAPAFVVLFPLVVFLILVLLPFIDRSPKRGMRRRPLVILIVILCILAILYLTDLRRRSPWTGWPDPNPPPVPAGVKIGDEAEQGRILFAKYGCNSCHAIAEHGPKVGTDLARLDHRYSRAELRKYTLRPPPGVPMPAYEGHITDEDLDRVVDFVLVAQTFPRRISRR